MESDFPPEAFRLMGLICSLCLPSGSIRRKQIPWDYPDRLPSLLRLLKGCGLIRLRRGLLSPTARGWTEGRLVLERQETLFRFLRLLAPPSRARQMAWCMAPYLGRDTAENLSRLNFWLQSQEEAPLKKPRTTKRAAKTGSPAA